mmetsp:Transcript_33051/g.40934  ORF Transcript_33051/g.40934 Transcript_33051/m.40934 type:complete len:85 (+) Transcript_33051:6-260(+)
MQDWREIPGEDGKVQYFNIKTGITQSEKPGTQPARAASAAPAKPEPSNTAKNVNSDGEPAQVISKEMQQLMEERNIKLPSHLLG